MADAIGVERCVNKVEKKGDECDWSSEGKDVEPLEGGLRGYIFSPLT